MASFIKDVHKAVQLKLFTDITYLKTVQEFRNQFERIEEEIAFDFPCVFIEFTAMDSMSLGQGVSSIDFVMRLYLGFEALDMSNGGIKYNGNIVLENLDFYDFQNDVHKCLNHYRPNGCSALQRTNIEQDTEHTNIYVVKMDYIFHGIDQATDITNGLQETGAPIELELGVDLIIDNPDIRTGKEII